VSVRVSTSRRAVRYRPARALAAEIRKWSLMQSAPNHHLPLGLTAVPFPVSTATSLVF